MLGMGGSRIALFVLLEKIAGRMFIDTLMRYVLILVFFVWRCCSDNSKAAPCLTVM